MCANRHSRQYINGLANDLLSYYGMRVIDWHEFCVHHKRWYMKLKPSNFVAKAKNPGISWDVMDNVFRFNTGFDAIKNINDFIYNNSFMWKSLNWKYYCRLTKKLLKFETYEDLDIQLTLLGYRKTFLDKGKLVSEQCIVDTI